jgi:hypothetical protein
LWGSAGVTFLAVTISQNFFIALGIFITIALGIKSMEQLRTIQVAKYFTALIHNKAGITDGTGVKALVLAVILTATMIVFDTYTALEAGSMAQERAIKTYIERDTAFTTAKLESENGALASKMLAKEQADWREDKKVHDAQCATSWGKGFKTKLAECKQDFRPYPTSMGKTVALDSTLISSVTDRAKREKGYVFVLIVALVFLMSVFFNFFAVSQIYARYRKLTKLSDAELIELGEAHKEIEKQEIENLKQLIKVGIDGKVLEARLKGEGERSNTVKRNEQLKQKLQNPPTQTSATNVGDEMEVVYTYIMGIRESGGKFPTRAELNAKFPKIRNGVFSDVNKRLAEEGIITPLKSGLTPKFL